VTLLRHPLLQIETSPLRLVVFVLPLALVIVGLRVLWNGLHIRNVVHGAHIVEELPLGVRGH
jgi:hypothetical protein